MTRTAWPSPWLAWFGLAMLALAGPGSTAQAHGVSNNPSATGATTGAGPGAAPDAPLGGPCPPQGVSLARLESSKAAGWPADLAIDPTALAACLDSPDPHLRDELAFDALQSWMRSGRLDPLQLRRLAAVLRTLMTLPDPAGFGPPFGALAMAEVARVDRLAPFLTPDERDALIRLSADFLLGWRDYRGFDEQAGWRHGIAHGADLALQWILNPAIDAGQTRALLAAVASQVMPAAPEPPSTPHFYRYGEGQRLMAPVFHAARRGLLDAAEWSAWIEALIAPVLADQQRPAFDQPRLARQHNLAGFLLPLAASLHEAPPSPALAQLRPALSQALRRLP